MLTNILIRWLVFIPFMCFGQNDKVVRVSFEVEDEEVDFSKGVNLTFNVDGREIQPLLFVNGFIVPDFGDTKTVDVCFSYEENKYCIERVSIVKFETNWTFGVDEKPFRDVNKPQTKGVRLVYYIKFQPKNGGDGTRVDVAIRR